MTEEDAHSRYEVMERIEQRALLIDGPDTAYGGPSRIHTGHGTPTPVVPLGPRLTNLQSDDIPDVDFDL